MRRHTRFLFIATAALFLIAMACAEDEFQGNDPPGYSCEYAAIGETAKSFTRPSPESLGMFDAFVRGRITGHEETGSPENIVNFGEVTDVVAGNVEVDDQIDVRDDFGVCLETREEYYLLLDEAAGGDFYEIRDPWSHFPVINNRITLHTDMRKDELIGEFHGLDPVLFKRRLVELTGRSDIEVD